MSLKGKEIAEPNSGSEEIEEPTPSEILRCLWTHESLSDMTICCRDEVSLHANRCVLAAKSRVFRAMLYGNFAESSAETPIRLDYNSSVVKVLLQYIYTDELVLDKNQQGKEANNSNCLLDLILSLLDASNYLELPNLRRRIKAWCQDYLKTQPQLAGLFLEKCIVHASDASTIQEVAMETIRSNLKALVKDEGILASITHPVLEIIVKDEKLEADEFEVFELILKWSKLEAYDSDGSGGATRLQQASQLTEHLKLQCIEPNELSTVVGPSGLVKQDKLLDAFKTQALQASSDHGVSYKRKRRKRPRKIKKKRVVRQEYYSSSDDYLSVLFNK